MATRASTAKTTPADTITDITTDVTTNISNVIQDATAKVETMVADTQKTVTEQIEKFTKGFEGMTAFGQENLDAVVKSSEIAAKAAEGIGTELSAYSKKAFEDGVAAAQELASAKTMTELFEKQTAFAQSAFEGWMQQTTKIAPTDTITDVTSDVTANISNVMQDATAKVETMVADTQKTVTEQIEKFTKGFEGLTAFGQENMDAMVKSSEIAAKAAEGIGTEISAYSKKAFEDGVAAAQELASAKTVTELFEKQTAFAQSAFEGWVAQTTKMNEIYAAAAKDISAPIGARVTKATEAMKSFSL
jgi:phasin family protein